MVEATADDAPTRKFGVRSGAFLVVLALVLVMFLPSINSALKQAQQIAALNNEISTTKAEVQELQKKNDQLRDPAEIARRARAEQYYVPKGKQAVIVVGGDSSAADPTEAAQPKRAQAWYLELLESIEQVGGSVEKG